MCHENSNTYDSTVNNSSILFFITQLESFNFVHLVVGANQIRIFVVVAKILIKLVINNFLRNSLKVLFTIFSVIYGNFITSVGSDILPYLNSITYNFLYNESVCLMNVGFHCIMNAFDLCNFFFELFFLTNRLYMQMNKYNYKTNCMAQIKK